MCIIHDSACSDSYHLGRNMIIQGMCTKKQLYSPCHKDLIWLSSFLFWLFFDFLCSSHCSSSLTFLFSSCNAYFLLLIIFVHSLPTCVGHCDSSTCCCTWEAFLLFFTHLSQCSSVPNRFVPDDTFNLQSCILLV